jgi:hypothetical protein
MLAQFTLALLIFISCWGLSMGILILVAKTVNPFLNRLLGLSIVIMAWPYIQTTLIANETNTQESLPIDIIERIIKMTRFPS